MFPPTAAARYTCSATSTRPLLNTMTHQQTANSSGTVQLPTEQVSYADAFKALFPDGVPDSAHTPIAAAWRRWHALLAGRFKEAAALSATPADWGDFSAATDDLSQFSLLHTIEQPDRIAYARFIPRTARPVRITEEASTDQGRWLTLVRRSDRRRYVSGLSDITFRPAPRRDLLNQTRPRRAAEPYHHRSVNRESQGMSTDPQTEVR